MLINPFSVRVPLLTEVAAEVERRGASTVMPDDLLFAAMAGADEKTLRLLAAAGITRDTVRQRRRGSPEISSKETSPRFSPASKAIVSEAVDRALSRRGTPDADDFILAVFAPALSAMEELATLFARLGVKADAVHLQLMQRLPDQA